MPAPPRRRWTALGAHLALAAAGLGTLGFAGPAAATGDPDPAPAAATALVAVPDSLALDLSLSDRAIEHGDLTTATVTVTGGDGVPPGRVELLLGDAVVASGTVVVDPADAGTGSVVMALPRDLPVGGHRVSAAYRGPGDVAASSEDVGLRVTPAAPDLALTAPDRPVRPGSTPTVTVTVSGDPGAPAPTGRVTVLLNLRRVGSADLGPDGRVTVPLPPVARASWVTALYGGDDGYGPHLAVRALPVR